MQEEFERIVNDTLKKGVNSKTLKNTIRELENLLLVESMKVQVENIMDNYVFDFESAKNSIDGHRVKTLDIPNNTNKKPSLALSMIQELL